MENEAGVLIPTKILGCKTMVPSRWSQTKVIFQERATVALGVNSHSALAVVGEGCWYRM